MPRVGDPLELHFAPQQSGLIFPPACGLPHATASGIVRDTTSDITKVTCKRCINSAKGKRARRMLEAMQVEGQEPKLNLGHKPPREEYYKVILKYHSKNAYIAAKFRHPGDAYDYACKVRSDNRDNASKSRDPLDWILCENV